MSKFNGMFETEYLTVADLAKRWGVSENHINYLAWDIGQIRPAILSGFKFAKPNNFKITTNNESLSCINISFASDKRPGLILPRQKVLYIDINQPKQRWSEHALAFCDTPSLLNEDDFEHEAPLFYPTMGYFENFEKDKLRLQVQFQYKNINALTDEQEKDAKPGFDYCDADIDFYFREDEIERAIAMGKDVLEISKYFDMRFKVEPKTIDYFFTIREVERVEKLQGGNSGAAEQLEPRLSASPQTDITNNIQINQYELTQNNFSIQPTLQVNNANYAKDKNISSEVEGESSALGGKKEDIKPEKNSIPSWTIELPHRTFKGRAYRELNKLFVEQYKKEPSEGAELWNFLEDELLPKEEALRHESNGTIKLRAFEHYIKRKALIEMYGRCIKALERA